MTSGEVQSKQQFGVEGTVCFHAVFTKARSAVQLRMLFITELYHAKLKYGHRYANIGMTRVSAAYFVF